MPPKTRVETPLFFPFSPYLRGEGRDEGRELALTFAYAAAPHPNPLPVSTGRGDDYTLIHVSEKASMAVEMVWPAT